MISHHIWECFDVLCRWDWITQRWSQKPNLSLIINLLLPSRLYWLDILSWRQYSSRHQDAELSQLSTSWIAQFPFRKYTVYCFPPGLSSRPSYIMCLSEEPDSTAWNMCPSSEINTVICHWREWRRWHGDRQLHFLRGGVEWRVGGRGGDRAWNSWWQLMMMEIRLNYLFKRTHIFRFIVVV